MYTRYKVVNKNRGIRKAIIPLLILGAVLYGGYRYRHHLQFWKYTSNKLNKKIEAAAKMKNRARRQEELQQLAGDMDRNKASNLTDADAYFNSGRVHYQLGESYLPGTFTELVINGKSTDVPPLARREFLIVLKDVKKGVSLTRKGRAGMEQAMMLAKAAYYADYMEAGEIKKILVDSGGAEDMSDPEDFRFYSILMILNKEEDRSIKLLTDHPEAVRGVQGKLFLATCEKIGRQYTNSIIHFTEVLNTTNDDDIRKLVRMNLGEIYYTQSLYQESLAQFMSASEIDGENLDIKLWLVKGYSAIGDKLKAREVLNQVLLKDKDNPEAKSLLGAL
ncbi:MAG: tetratricopeptide repeat protein [Spirochaetes bacterium]|nr:tetratricopeptide repeat protein [Spirochaetota bacterium]